MERGVTVPRRGPWREGIEYLGEGRGEGFEYLE